MGIPQTIDERCQLLEAHRTELLTEWHKHPRAGKIVAGITMLATGVAGGLFIRRIGFGKVRKFYTYAMLVSRIKSQIQERHISEMRPHLRKPAPRRKGAKAQSGAAAR